MHQCDLPCGVQLCTDAKEGSMCRTEVERILANLDDKELPECFQPGYGNPTHADVQAYLHSRYGDHECMPPCGKAELFPCGQSERKCHDAVNDVGTECYENVQHLIMQVQQQLKDPDSEIAGHFKELPSELIGASPTEASVEAVPFAKWQMYLHQLDGGHNCEKPCDEAGKLICHDISSESHPACYRHVLWAMKTGVKSYPQWYPDLLVNGWDDPETGKHLIPTEQWFQMYFFEMDGGHECPKPCQPLPVLIPQLSVVTNDRQHNCITATPEIEPACYEQVTFAKLDLRVNSGTLYPSYLNKDSTDAEIQYYLYSQSGLDPNPCSLPCGVATCTDAKDEADPCHRHVIWAMENGVKAHPEWYPECLLDHTKGATFTDFQMYLYAANGGLGVHECKKPCGQPTVFLADGCATDKSLCSNAVKGDKCFELIMQWKTAAEKSGEYPLGLDESSTTTDWQGFLSEQGIGRQCPTPCDPYSLLTTTPTIAPGKVNPAIPTNKLPTGPPKNDAPSSGSGGSKKSSNGPFTTILIVAAIAVIVGAVVFIYLRSSGKSVVVYSIQADDPDDAAMLAEIE